MAVVDFILSVDQASTVFRAGVICYPTPAADASSPECPKEEINGIFCIHALISTFKTQHRALQLIQAVQRSIAGHLLQQCFAAVCGYSSSPWIRSAEDSSTIRPLVRAPIVWHVFLPRSIANQYRITRPALVDAFRMRGVLSVVKRSGFICVTLFIWLIY